MFDVSKLGVIDAALLSDVVRLANLQAPNSIHRYPNDKYISQEMEELEKSQKELDAEIAQVCFHYRSLMVSSLCEIQHGGICYDKSKTKKFHSVFSNDYKAYDMNNFGNEAKYGES